MKSNFVFSPLLLSSLFAFVFWVYGCDSRAQQNQKIGPQEFETAISVSKTFTLLDVRTLEEYEAGHLKDAVLLDFYQSDFKKQLSKLDKTKPVFVYCAVGGRSGSTASILVELGFKKVYDLKGGIQSWRQEGKAIVK